MNNYSSKQNRFFTAPACEDAFSCASAYGMKIMGIAVAMSILLICVLFLRRVIRLCISLVIAVLIISAIIGSVICYSIGTFQTCG